MRTEDFQFVGYPGVVQYVRKIYQTAADAPKKSNKRNAIASLFLNVTNTPMKTEDFHVFLYPGVVQDFRNFTKRQPGTLKGPRGP